MNRVFAIVVGTMLILSLMWPSEGATGGDGLHLAFSWLAVCACFLLIVRPEFSRRSFDWTRWVAPLAVACLAGGIWVSTWHVFRVQGDRRAALNLAMEWSAIAAAWFLCRRLPAGVRRKFLPALIVSAAAGSAVLGIVQHHVIHAQHSAWYTGQRERLDAAVAAGPAGAISRAEVEAEFRRMDIPVDGPERQLFERRLLDSSEPTGPFALANSLGGLLAVACVLLLAVIIERLRGEHQHSWQSWLVIAGMVTLITYSLILTKSRTAWVATGVGTAVALLRLRGPALSRNTLKVAVVGGLMVTTLVGAAMAVGALDKEVVLESPRSIRFRLFYWMGSASVISESPVFGTGPGNFRPAYLSHKVAESSEEIQDPHNILFDVWTSAGLIGLAGLFALPLSLWAAHRKTPSDGQSASGDWNRDPGHTDGDRRSIMISAVLSLLLFIAWHWLNGGDLGGSIVAGPIGWLGGVWMVPATVLLTGPLIIRTIADGRSIALPCVVTLLIHLTGAGGLQITGIMLILLVLHAIATANGSAESVDAGSTPAEAGSGQVLLPVGAGVFVAALAAWTLYSGLIPVQKARMERGMGALLQSRRNVSAAEKAFRKATVEDPLCVESCQQLTELLAYEFLEDCRRLKQTLPENGEIPDELRDRYLIVQSAVADLKAADRRRWVGYHLLGRVHQHYARLTGDPDTSVLATAEMRQAAEMYPTNSRLQAELAKLLDEFGNHDQARSVADVALQQDEMNRAWGHSDRYLDESTVDTLTRIRDGG